MEKKWQNETYVQREKLKKNVLAYVEKTIEPLYIVTNIVLRKGLMLPWKVIRRIEMTKVNRITARRFISTKLTISTTELNIYEYTEYIAGILMQRRYN